MVVLYIVVIVIALLVLPFIAPFRYRAEGKVAENSAFKVDISWLFGLIKCRLSSESDGFSFKLRIAGIPLNRKKSAKAEKKHAKKHAKKRAKALVETPDEPIEHPVSEASAEQEPVKSDSKKEPPVSHQHQEQESDKKLSGLTDIWTRFKALLTYPDREIIIHLCYNSIKKLIPVLLPKELRVDGVIGLDDPFATGLLIGAYEAAAGMMGLRRDIRIRGNFEKQALQLEFFVAGGISVASVIGPVAWFCWQKPIRRIIMNMIQDKPLI